MKPRILQILDDIVAQLLITIRGTSSNKTYYVDTVNGNDANDGLASGAGHALKTIMAAVNKLPQIINHTIEIDVTAGTYNELVSFKGFSGAGSIMLLGNTSTRNSYVIPTVEIINCSTLVTITGFKITSNNNTGVFITNSFVDIISCNIDTLVKTDSGIMCNRSLVNVHSCDLSNNNVAIYALYMSTVLSDENTGSNNFVGLKSVYASTIGKRNGQPSGTTAESILNGGTIR